MKHITSRDNPTFKAWRVLAEHTRVQRRQGQTLLDGIHLVSAYRDKIGRPRQLIISEQGAGHTEIQALCHSLADVDTWLLRDNLFSQLTDTVSPVGVLALVDIPDSQRRAHADASSWVLLDAVQDAGNVGSILRTAAAAGIANVLLGPGCAAAWSARVLRAAQGAHFDLHIEEQVDLAGFLGASPLMSVAASAHATRTLYQLDLQAPLVWLFGNEGQGIRPALEALVRQRARIPLMPACESLNVAAAAAICLFEEVRQKQHAVPTR